MSEMQQAPTRKWFPHLCFAGEPMHEGQFREPWPMQEEIALAGAALVEAWNSDGDGFSNTLPPIEFSKAELSHLVRAVLSLQEATQIERYRHIKRGTVYEVVGRAELQTVGPGVDILQDGDLLVIYRGEDGKLWARESGEFNDGRFEPLATPTSETDQLGGVAV